MQSVRVLIVDDSSVMRKIVQRCLQQAGVELAEVREANNGTDALDIAAKNPLDLILCDLNMPVMDGIEFVRRLKHVEHARNTPVVMVSSEGGESHVLHALSAGARGYIRTLYNGSSQGTRGAAVGCGGEMKSGPHPHWFLAIANA
jgi:two-component system, chemotaxis family, chemotaxis protein CheY